ncbi:MULTISPECIES: ParA family protein [Bacillus]|uniref:ParA family protein n=1 Tax=Bacillus cereus group TaxID=86661 RepID=UPI0005E3D239|nr:MULTISPECIES: ParA family protein [Bacillus cereus group]CGG48051.1 chromosome partitioning protein parA [Streptococcus pneumoniae]MDA2089779.1 ParA family protein [Bacillus cereus]MDA2363093.1 ParA family protein [Bacillus cereus]MDA2368165.1 ParA family protein [Bacillus cereus]MDA2373440.1 ParA family protein [Bacillus cereus]
MGKIITFINMKGGVGKTTLAVNVGYTMAKMYKLKVLLIDMDPQMNATQYTLNDEQVRSILTKPTNSIFGILSPQLDLPGVIKGGKEEEPEFIYPIYENFDIIPSHLQLMSLNLNERPLRLKQFIRERKLNEIYDVIILDCPPTISGYTKLSLLSSDGYIVPMKTDYLSFFGLPLLENYIRSLKDDFEQDLEFLGITLTMVKSNWNIYEDVKALIKKDVKWKRKLFSSELKARTLIEKALSPENKKNGKTYIIDLGDEETTKQMIAITQEFMRKARV